MHARILANRRAEDSTQRFRLHERSELLQFGHQGHQLISQRKLHRRCLGNYELPSSRRPSRDDGTDESGNRFGFVSINYVRQRH